MRQGLAEFTSTNVHFTPHDCRWVPNSARFVVVGETAKSNGVLSVFQLNESGIETTSKIERVSGLKCCTFGSHTMPERFLVAATLRGELETWDLEQPVEPVNFTKAHDAAINSIDGAGGGPHGVGPLEIVTGDRHGVVKVWDFRQESPVAVFCPSVTPACECWSVVFGNSFDDTERCILAGYENGDVKVFDLRAGSVRFQTNLANGVCSVEFDRKDIPMNKFVATCLESQFVIFDARTQHPVEGFASKTHNTRSKTTLWGVRHLPQDRELMTALLGDGSVELYRYEYPARRETQHPDGSLRGVVGEINRISSTQLSTQPINSWDWHAERKGLAVCTSFDQCVRVVVAHYV